MKKVKVNYEWLVPTSRDFPAEWHEENGCYMCRCSQCGYIFYGRKRRVVCRDCMFENMEQMLKDNERKEILLKATYDILKKCEASSYVLNVFEQTALWDNAECDGYCLMDEIEEELGLDV